MWLFHLSHFHLLESVTSESCISILYGKPLTSMWIVHIPTWWCSSSDIGVPESHSENCLGSMMWSSIVRPMVETTSPRWQLFHVFRLRPCTNTPFGMLWWCHGDATRGFFPCWWNQHIEEDSVQYIYRHINQTDSTRYFCVFSSVSFPCICFLRKLQKPAICCDFPGATTVESVDAFGVATGEASTVFQISIDTRPGWYHQWARPWKVFLQLGSCPNSKLVEEEMNYENSLMCLMMSNVLYFTIWMTTHAFLHFYLKW